jgi:hypothetical protein
MLMRTFTLSLLVAAFAGAVALSGASVGAQSPQFRSDVTVRGMAPPGAIADDILTFSAPISIPGASLKQGTYVFKRLSGDTVQVLSADRKRIFTIAYTLPVTRTNVTSGYHVQFREPAAAGAPQRMIAWFRPGESAGRELVYPNQARPQADGN